MASMEETLQSSVASGEVPGVVLLAKDKSGKLDYARSLGVRSGKADQPQKLMTMDTIMRFASASKLITSIMCLQCVERGLLDLNADVKELLPEVAGFDVLTGFDKDGKPETRKREKKITLSSGLCFDAMHPLLIQYRRYQGIELQPNGDKIEDRFIYPLVYEPGEGWTYGPNIEWLGRLLERATGKSLEEYMQQNICRPLGITDMTFKLQQRPDMIDARADMSERFDDGTIKTVDREFWNHDPVDAMGGMGIFTSPRSYMKVMHSILSDDGKLLGSQMVDQLFQPQLEPKAQSALMELYEIEEMNSKMGSLLPKGAKKDHGLAGMLITEPLDGEKWRSEGTLTWSGMPNVFWMIDRKAGLCALYTSQLQPPGDEKSIELARLFERDMYARLRGV